MKVEIGKEYRLANGAPYRLYCVDAGGDYPVHGSTTNLINEWIFLSHTLDGKNDLSMDGDYDLVEVLPYDDFKIDDKVIVSSENYPHKEYKRYFAGVAANGNPLTFRGGVTSWSKDAEWVDEWATCRKYEGE